VSETTLAATYLEADNQMLAASNGVSYSYRATGAADATPLVLLKHFRGNLDNWDPALIDALVRGRRVITFDNRGVAASSGTTPNTIVQMALARERLVPRIGCANLPLVAACCSKNQVGSSARGEAPTSGSTV
jgi:pimeloyl-ACP methyl ester carboxylesterase